MKLRTIRKLQKPTEQNVEEQPKKTLKKKDTTKKKKTENTLPSDEYKPMFPPTRILVREIPNYKEPSKVTKHYLELSVKRFKDDDENAPMVYVQMYQESDFYTGYLKGRTVYIPLEMLYDFIDGLSDLSEECDKRNIV